MDYATTGNNQASSAKLPPPRQAPDFTAPVAAAAEEVQSLRLRIESLAGKLCGNVPETDADGLHGVPSGVFEIVSDFGRVISSDVARAREALDRIERSLP